jgi:tetratricopeptide (TPR) repeat protein
MKRLSLPRLRLRRPQAGVAMLLLALLIGACAGGETIRSRNQDANDAYNRGSYQEALDIYQELIARRPDIAELSVNAGNALDRAGLYQRAVQETQRALPPANDKTGAITYYDLGNHYFALKEYQLAADSYRNALVIDPADEDSKFNLELSLLALNSGAQDPGQQGQPQPGQSGDEGDQPQQPGGEGGEPQQPQDQQGQPGADQQPGQADQQPGQPGASDVQRQLQDALRGLNENLTYEEAQRILDLLQQQQQQQRLPGGSTTPSGPDY